ncbi:MAG TPA: tetratricopeptide repeat protein [Gemmataceae bacterium]|nr:tetratricopeptide repeat protein [Gemmataceae bacterium]
MAGKSRRQALEEMLAADPTDVETRYCLGMDYVGAGDPESAARVFREVIAQNPAKPYIPAFQMAAQSLLKLGRRNDVIAILKQGIKEAQKQNDLHPMSEMQALLDSVE